MANWQIYFKAPEMYSLLKSIQDPGSGINWNKASDLKLEADRLLGYIGDDTYTKYVASEQVDPCPFCKGKPQIINMALLQEVLGNEVESSDSKQFAVVCSKCGASPSKLNPQPTIELAIEVWNTRFPSRSDPNWDTNIRLLHLIHQMINAREATLLASRQVISEENSQQSRAQVNEAILKEQQTFQQARDTLCELLADFPLWL